MCSFLTWRTDILGEIPTLPNVEQVQKEDQGIRPVLEWLTKSPVRPDWSTVAPFNEMTKILWAQWDSLRIHGGCLYRLWEGTPPVLSRYQLVVPEKLRTEVLSQLHGSQTAAHFGVSKTLERLKQKFYWPRCRLDVQLWCERCDICAAKKGPRRRSKAPLKLYTV